MQDCVERSMALQQMSAWLLKHGCACRLVFHAQKGVHSLLCVCVCVSPTLGRR